MAFPPAPWRLHGELILIPTRWGGVMLADYQGGTLTYHELIVFRPGFVVAHIYVDSPESMRGGRAIWKLPKQLADFAWSRGHVRVAQDGRTLFDARIRRRAGFVPWVMPGPAIGEGGKLSVGRLRMRATLALVQAQGFGLDGRHVALAGDRMRLFMA